MSNHKGNSKVFYSVKNKDKVDMFSSNSLNYKGANSTMHATSTKERFCYHDDEKLYKTLIKITNVVPYDKESGKIIGNNYKNSMGQRLLSDGAVNREHMRYKKNKGHNLDKYRSVSQSNVETLSNKVNKYIEHDLNTDEYYSCLLKNKIDPDAKQVTKIFHELDVQGSTGVNQAVNKLRKIKNFSMHQDNLEKRIVVNPINQTMTSYDQFNKIKRNKSFDSASNSSEQIKFNKLKSSGIYNTAKKQNVVSTDKSADMNNKIINSCEDNLGLGNLKRRFTNSTIKRHHNESMDMISHAKKDPKTIKSITVKSVNNIDNHKSKKIDFMTSSTAFKIDTQPIDKNSLVKKHYKSIIQNYSAKDTLSFATNTKNPKVAKEMQIYINIENKGRPKKDKNIISSGNLVCCSKEKTREALKGGANEKIVGMFGKGKATNSNKVDQSNSDYKTLFAWKVEKTKNDFSKNATNNTHDKSLYNPSNDYNKSLKNKSNVFSNGLSNGKKVETHNTLNTSTVNKTNNNRGENFDERSSRTQNNKGFGTLKNRKL
jgi:hypothetical protein